MINCCFTFIMSYNLRAIHYDNNFTLVLHKTSVLRLGLLALSEVHVALPLMVSHVLKLSLAIIATSLRHADKVLEPICQFFEKVCIRGGQR